MKNKRIEAIDIFRGWAIVLMIGYHFGYDLNLFGYIHTHPNSNELWILVRYTIITMFLLSMGMSLKLVHLEEIKWKKVIKRSIILGVASILVTISTYIEFPRSWVYFGILHFIFVSSLVGLLFLSYPRFSLFVAISIFITYALGWLKFHSLYILLKETLSLPRYTQDFVPFLPWFAVVLIGIVIVSYEWHKRLPPNSFLGADTALNRVLGFMGRYSLIIYLIHIPIIFGIFLLIRLL
ncbi:MAG: heparan-alpha-glucosaminide N-acetyltransferase [Sulfurovum sp.]